MKKVALVTGASRGLGAKIALGFAMSGYRVAINYRAGRPEALRLSRTIARRGKECAVVQADIARRAEVKKMTESVIARWGRIDVLVNNAGITRESLLPVTGETEWDRVMNVNLKGAFNCSQFAARRMVKQGSGHIINIVSILGVWGARGEAAYAASKAALIGFTKCLAAELGPYGIRVNAVIPGFMATRMTNSLAGEIIKGVRRASPLGELSDTAAAAGLVVHLAGIKTVTGQLLSLDGRISRWT